MCVVVGVCLGERLARPAPGGYVKVLKTFSQAAGFLSNYDNLADNGGGASVCKPMAVSSYASGCVHIAAAEYPSHIVRKGNGVYAKVVSREHAAATCLILEPCFDTLRAGALVGCSVHFRDGGSRETVETVGDRGAGRRRWRRAMLSSRWHWA
jgi:hypothetical protein